MGLRSDIVDGTRQPPAELTRTPPHLVPEAVIASRSLSRGCIEFIVESVHPGRDAALQDPDAVIVSVNDGSGWREPKHSHLPEGETLDTYRIKRRSVVAGRFAGHSGKTDPVTYWAHIQLRPAVQPRPI